MKICQSFNPFAPRFLSHWSSHLLRSIAEHIVIDLNVSTTQSIEIGTQHLGTRFEAGLKGLNYINCNRFFGFTSKKQQTCNMDLPSSNCSRTCGLSEINFQQKNSAAVDLQRFNQQIERTTLLLQTGQLLIFWDINFLTCSGICLVYCGPKAGHNISKQASKKV